jgi:hypothetical protein
MRLFKLLIAVTCTVLLVACAAPQNKTFAPPTDYVPNNQIVITSKFKVVTVTRENFFYEANKCVQSYNPDATAIRKTLEKYPSKDLLGVGHVRSSKTFVLHLNKGFCLERSASDFPIFAAEAIANTVNPIGVSPLISDNWYKHIAMYIATKGTAKIAYTFPNGNAFIATYWVASTKTSSLYYSSEFKKVGTWEKEIFDRKFFHPTSTSVAETKRSDQYVKHILNEEAYVDNASPDLTAAQFIAQATPPIPANNLTPPKIITETNNNVTNIRAEGSLASKNNIGCIEISNVKNQNTPADMYKGVAACMEQGNYEWAYRLYALAGLYAKFDAERITDETARQASTVLIINTMSPIAKEKRDKLMEVQSAILKSPQELSKLCQQVQKVGMPNYYPSYMIFHGVKAFMGNPNIGALKENLDLNVVWKDSQKSYLKCEV